MSAPPTPTSPTLALACLMTGGTRLQAGATCSPSTPTALPAAPCLWASAAAPLASTSSSLGSTCGRVRLPAPAAPAPFQPCVLGSRPHSGRLPAPGGWVGGRVATAAHRSRRCLARTAAGTLRMHFMIPFAREYVLSHGYTDVRQAHSAAHASAQA